MVTLLSFSVSAVPTESSSPIINSNYSEAYQLENSFIGPININQVNENATADITDEFYQFEPGFIGPVNTAASSCQACAAAYAACLLIAIDGSSCYTIYQACAAFFC